MKDLLPKHLTFEPTRLKRQLGIAHEWQTRGFRGTVTAATGFGKTTVGMIAHALSRHQAPPGSPPTIIVVPTLYLQNQWTEVLHAWGIRGAEVWVVNSFVKQQHQAQLLILDEIHSYTSEIFSRVFTCVKYKQILGLTATLKDDDERNKIILQYAPIIDTITLEEALKNKWISDYVVYNIGVCLPEDLQEEYTRLSSAFGKWFAIFNHDFTYAMKCVGNREERRRLAERLETDPKQIDAAAFQWMRTMRLRKELLYDTGVKLDAAERIINQFPEKRIITFCQTISGADSIASRFPDRALAYHTDIKGETIYGRRLTKKDVLKLIIDRFSDDVPREEGGYAHINVLSTARALDQGADLPFIDMAIVVSGSSKTLQALQRHGRALRKQGDKQTVIIELYVQNTTDERWLRDRQRKLPKEVIHWLPSIDSLPI